jgi:hypothetical protein
VEFIRITGFTFLRTRFLHHSRFDLSLLRFGKRNDANAFSADEANQTWINAVWCGTFIIVFFAIHIGRMHVDWNLTGMISPLVATVGDVATALIIAFALNETWRLIGPTQSCSEKGIPEDSAEGNPWFCPLTPTCPLTLPQGSRQLHRS